MKKLLQDLLESEKKNYQDFVAHRCIAPSARMSTTAVVIHSDPDILGAMLMFGGTRVPLRNLIFSIHSRRCRGNRRWQHWRPFTKR